MELCSYVFFLRACPGSDTGQPTASAKKAIISKLFDTFVSAKRCSVPGIRKHDLLQHLVCKSNDNGRKDSYIFYNLLRVKIHMKTFRLQ